MPDPGRAGAEAGRADAWAGRAGPRAAGAGPRAAGAGPAAMIRCVLCDYGEVISAPLGESAIVALAALAGQPRGTFLDRYWRGRASYDLGQPADQYWAQVLDRDVSGSARLVRRLTDIDVRGWLRVNPLTLRVLEDCARRTGARLALLSNAPEPLAQGIDRCGWSKQFGQRYYSCRLGVAKPDPQAFRLVLDDLGVPPEQVLFIDDRADNTSTARSLGLHTITFTGAGDLDRDLRGAGDRGRDLRAL